MAEWILVPSETDLEATAAQTGWAIAQELEDSSLELLGMFEELALYRLGPALFGLRLMGHLGRKPLVSAMRRAWTDPTATDGWAMVVVAAPGTTYDTDVRNVYKAEDLRPAAHVAVVTQRLLHRVVVTGLSLPVRAATGSVLSVHQHLDEAWQAAESTLQARCLGATGS